MSDQQYLNYDNLDEQLLQENDDQNNEALNDTEQLQEVDNTNLIAEQDEEDEDSSNQDKEVQEYRQMVRRLGLREKEIHDTFIINEDKIRALMSDQEKQILKVSDLIIFKDKADDIIGVELDSYIEFLINHTLQKKAKRQFSFKELKNNFLYWLDHQYKERNRDPAQVEYERQMEESLRQEEKAIKLQNEEKFNWRKRMSIEILNFKLDKHKERLQEVFQRYNKTQEQGYQQSAFIRIKQSKQLFSDIAYIAGVVFCYNREFEETNQYAGFKDSSQKFIKEFKRFLWRHLHEMRPNKRNSQLKCLRQQSPEGYYDARQESQQRVFFDDDLYILEKLNTAFDFSTFKKVLKMFIQDKKIVAIDLNAEYTKHMKKQANKDIKASLQNTIQEYEELVKTTEDEQQRQRVERLIEQMKRELSILSQNNPTKMGSVNNDFISVINPDYNPDSSFISASNEQQFSIGINNNLEDERDNFNFSKRQKALQQVFNIYSKQHIPYNDIRFEQFEDISKRVKVGDFLKFCKDFQINKSLGLKKELLTNIFHKAGSCHKPVIFDEFIKALQLISLEINKVQIEINEKELKEAEDQIQKLADEFKARDDEHVKYLQIKNENKNPYKKFTEEEKKEFKKNDREQKEKRDGLVKELQKLKAKTLDHTLDELYKYMELDIPQAYQKKLKGFHLPFFIHEKYERIPEDDPGQRYKVRFKKIPFSDVKKVVQEIREKREKDKNDKMMEQNEKYIRKMKFIQKTHDRLRQEKLKKIVEERKLIESQHNSQDRKSSDQHGRQVSPQNNNTKAGSYAQQLPSNPFSYLEIKNTKQGQPIQEGRNLKVTLDILTKMHYQDFNNAGDKKQQFNPMDLIQGNSDQDEVAGMIMNDSASGEDEHDIDDFTRKRMPKAQDFRIKLEEQKQQKKTIKKNASQSLLNDYQEKILSLKNQTTQPQNQLVLRDSYDVSNNKKGKSLLLNKNNLNNLHSKSVVSLQPLADIKGPKGKYDSVVIPSQNKQKQYQLVNPKHASAIGRYENQIPQMQSIQPINLQGKHSMIRNASQGNIVKANHMDQLHQNVSYCQSYNILQKMEGILKMHDRQIQKGMKVLKK
ncbi:UNKNOWN [Stylonychia lemnae]|uniref:Uncharacterized protein n=1 Tax=Stylonychia lemnae TaxID=5949 RepID=A0A078A888_STYLE|nr:UNKNOWN [Stylonychia lemnae]|eukprot:CDW77792.1 UNKNOWN [Stylonychia lemnae]